ncbi:MULTISPECIES: hypothetical protein [Pseudanabaena]|uniref:Uncharacterized protein n=1 Tax=Pseudanabaena catenata USMAC16 TaxID=1855837 RepID=A0A9X4MA29_9CYAN|nr:MULTISPECIES: hypothetical protein [Pseudanabaena]MDG3495400.1 hypothetical protein [Pseudanabaena catenata USMAC16]
MPNYLQVETPRMDDSAESRHSSLGLHVLSKTCVAILNIRNNVNLLK